MLAFLRAAALNVAIAILAVLTFAFPAGATTSQVTLSSTAWTLLGSGPMTVAVATSSSNTTNAKQIIFQSSALAPSAGSNVGLYLSVEQQNFANQLSFQGPIYAKVLTNDGNTGALVLTVALSSGSVASTAISQNSASAVQVIPASAGLVTYVNGYTVGAASAVGLTWEYGTGTNCGTGTTVLSGAIPLAATSPISPSAGNSPVLVVPAGNALCALTSSAVQISGSLSYSQF